MLTHAHTWIQEAARIMAPRSRVGGMARLQAAITLDSLGRSQEAKELYHSLRGHPAGDIAKRAGRLLFGFQVSSLHSRVTEL